MLQASQNKAFFDKNEQLSLSDIFQIAKIH